MAVLFIAPSAQAVKCIGLKKAYKGKCYYPEEIAKLKARQSARKAQVNVTSTVEGADVYLNGEKVGTTPWKSKLLKPGRYSVAVSRENHRKVEQWVELKRGDRIELTLDPIPKQGNLSLKAKGSDGRTLQATVFSKKESLGTTPLELTLDTGAYTMTLRDPGGRYEETTIQFTIEDGQLISRDVVLKRPPPQRLTRRSKQPSKANRGNTKEPLPEASEPDTGRFFAHANAGLGVFFMSESPGGANERSSSSLSFLADLRLGLSIDDTTILFLTAAIAPTLAKPGITVTSSLELPSLASSYFPFFVGLGATSFNLRGRNISVSGAVGVMGLNFKDVRLPDEACGTVAMDADYVTDETTFAGTTGKGEFCSEKRGDFMKIGFGVMGDLTYPIARTDTVLVSLGAQLSLAIINTTAGRSAGNIDITNLVGTVGGTLSLVYH